MSAVRRFSFTPDSIGQGGSILTPNEPPSTRLTKGLSLVSTYRNQLAKHVTRSQATQWLNRVSLSSQGRIERLWHRMVRRQTIAHAPSMAKSAIMLALGIAMINIFLLSNDAILAANENPWDTYTDVNPKQSESAIEAIAQYTPIIQDDSETLAVALTTDGAGDFLPKPDDSQHATERTQLEQTYTVANGDTLSTIAAKFNLHIATIVDRNRLSVESIESLKPGDALTIPANDTSDSTDWLVALNEKKAEVAKQQAAEAAKAAAKKNQQLANTGGRTTKQQSSAGFSGAAGGGITSFSLPMRYTGITRGVGRGHEGIDYTAPSGTPVRAAASGRVIEITGGWGGGFGNSVLIDHGNGLTTRYAHLSRVEVSIGDTVGQGSEIALSGNTGFSTGPHLHFQTEINGRVVNPVLASSNLGL